MQTILPLEIIPIEDEGFHIVTEVLVNGEKARLLIDTGASRTVFDLQRITNFPGIASDVFKKMEKSSSGLGTNTMESFTFLIDDFRLNEIGLTEFEAVLVDMIHVNQSYEILGMPPIDGVLGGDILVEYDAVIDYGSQDLKLTLKD